MICCPAWQATVHPPMKFWAGAIPVVQSTKQCKSFNAQLQHAVLDGYVLRHVHEPGLEAFPLPRTKCAHRLLRNDFERSLKRPFSLEIRAVKKKLAPANIRDIQPARRVQLCLQSMGHENGIRVHLHCKCILLVDAILEYVLPGPVKDVCIEEQPVLEEFCAVVGFRPWDWNGLHRQLCPASQCNGLRPPVRVNSPGLTRENAQAFSE
mmetsp:Transcript_81503/g.147192  ORF Transcript_81503/g.147192 Transcript_81503/m.147192 type:complete len:208 (+) Transcript_81503:196-819(+)